MALARDSGLLTTIAEVVDETGVQDITNLEAGGELTATTLLGKARGWVFDRLEQRFGPTDVVLISNGDRLHRAQAARFLELLAAGNYLPASTVDPNYWGQQAREEVDLFRPVFSPVDDQPRRSGEAIPSVTNLFSGPRFLTTF